MPRIPRNLTNETVIVVLKRIIGELEYYSLNKPRDRYYHLEKIAQDHVKLMKDDSNEV